MKTDIVNYSIEECEIKDGDIITIQSNNTTKLLVYLVDNECCEYLLNLNNMKLDFLSLGDELISGYPDEYQVYYYIKEELLQKGEVIIAVQNHDNFKIKEIKSI